MTGSSKTSIFLRSIFLPYQRFCFAMAQDKMNASAGTINLYPPSWSQILDFVTSDPGARFIGVRLWLGAIRPILNSLCRKD